MVSETQIYLTLKKYLPEKGWILVGGEPPDGTNSMPRIELKDDTHLVKGSKGSKKIDLLFFKEGYFLLLELKEMYNFSDVKKLIRAIAYSEGTSNHAEFVTFVIGKSGIKLIYGDNIRQEIKKLF